MNDKSLLEIYRDIRGQCGDCLSGCPGCNYFEGVLEPLIRKIISRHNLDPDKDVLEQIDKLDKKLNYVTIDGKEFLKADFYDMIFQEQFLKKGNVFRIQVRVIDDNPLPAVHEYKLEDRAAYEKECARLRKEFDR